MISFSFPSPKKLKCYLSKNNNESQKLLHLLIYFCLKEREWEMFTNCNSDFKYLGSLGFAYDGGMDGEVVCGI